MTNQRVLGTSTAPIEEAMLAGDIEMKCGGPLVLIVDGDRLAADTWSAIFRLHGYRVMTAYDGISGFALATGTAPDLLITGVSMTGMNGVDLALQVKGAIPSCKILLFAGQSPKEMLAAAGAQEFGFQMVLRPVHPTRMLQQAAAWLQAA
jgi:CheY-like chemotaxis protein